MFHQPHLCPPSVARRGSFPATLSTLGLTIVLTSILAGCGGGTPASSNSGGTQPLPPTPPLTLRGQPIGSASVVPVAVGGFRVTTVEPAQMKALVEASVSYGSAVTGTPTCAVTLYTLRYHTLDGQGADTEASTAIMLPSGSQPACQGSRPVLLYAHGTSALKSNDMADLSGTEVRTVAAMFAAQGYIVVAPNYAGYAGSTLDYHPYLDASQQSADMIDALRAARSVLPGLGASASSRLMVSGYSQGGFVAMATQRAMQRDYASEFTVTAAAPLSGPYALLQFGDAIFNGAPTLGSSGFLPMLFTAAQRAGANLYTSPTQVYAAQYASGIETLLPGSLSLGALVTAGKLPNDVLFAQDSLPQSSGYSRYFGADHLLSSAYRDSYLSDLKAQPCNASNNAPLNCAPAQALRRWLLKNDLRTYTPVLPMLLCGGNQDPVVPFANTDAAVAYFRAQSMGAGLLAVLDLDDSALLGDYRTVRAEFAAAKQVLKLSITQAGGSNADANQALRDSYHAGLVAPFCLREARKFFDAAPAR